MNTFGCLVFVEMDFDIVTLAREDKHCIVFFRYYCFKPTMSQIYQWSAWLNWSAPGYWLGCIHDRRDLEQEQVALDMIKMNQAAAPTAYQQLYARYVSDLTGEHHLPVPVRLAGHGCPRPAQHPGQARSDIGRGRKAPIWSKDWLFKPWRIFQRH